MKTLKVVCAILIASMVVPITMQAQCNRPFMGQQMAEQFDLSDEQIEQIKEIRVSLQEELIPLRNQMNEKRAQMRTLTTGNDVDYEAAEGVLAEISELRNTMMTKRLRMHKEVRELLTDEQRLKFDMRKRNFFSNNANCNRNKPRMMKRKMYQR